MTKKKTPTATARATGARSTNKTGWTSVQLYIGGCTGSFNSQAARILPADDGSTGIITKPIHRGAAMRRRFLYKKC